MDSAMSVLSEIPRRYAVPAVTAGAAWLDAKYGLTQDIAGVYKALRYAFLMARLEKRDRVNCFYLLEEWAQNPKSAGRPFLIIPPDEHNPDQQTQWTYAEAYETILKYAAWLKEKYTIQKGEFIAMDFLNTPRFVWMWFALWSLGAKPAFINSNLRDNALIHCIKISTSRLLVLDGQISDALTDEVKQAIAPDEAGRAVETVVFDADVEQQVLASTPYRAPDHIRSGETPTTVSLLVYTSGTTGLPKAANVNWGKPLSGVYFFASVLGLTATDRYFTAMPLYHSSAALLGLCDVLGPGCAIVLSPKFSPRTFMRQLCETEATAVQYIGEACRYLVSSPPSPYDRAHKVTRAFGNGMRPDVWQRFKDRFNIDTIVEFYGATEGPAATLVRSRNDFLRGAIGKQGAFVRNLMQTNILVKHDHETDAPWRDPRTGLCVRVPYNVTGELLNPLDANDIEAKYHGYHGNDKATNSKIMRSVFKKDDAYYRTGDLVRQDSDGRIWFMDRIGDTFRWKGENVSTAEVSEALGSHPSVKEANVYGVQLPQHDGRAGCAALTLSGDNPDVKLDSSIAQALATHARRRLPRYAVPLFLRVVKEVEVTGTMKHQKVALRNQSVDPAQMGDDDVFWLAPGADAYAPFGENEWKRIQAGEIKL